MTTPLQKAAQAVIDKWEQSHPLKELAILELRKALDAELQQSVEPGAWAMRRADGLVLDVICPEEHESHEGNYTVPLYLHPPQQTLRECWYESDELEVCRKCGQLHDKAIPPQQAKQVPVGAAMQQALDTLQELWLLGDKAAAIANPAIESLKFAISQPPARPLENAEIDLLGVSGIEQFPTLFNRVPWGGELMMYVRQLARALEAHHGIGGQP